MEFELLQAWICLEILVDPIYYVKRSNILVVGQFEN